MMRDAHAQVMSVMSKSEIKRQLQLCSFGYFRVSIEKKNQIEVRGKLATSLSRTGPPSSKIPERAEESSRRDK